MSCDIKFKDTESCRKCAEAIAREVRKDMMNAAECDGCIRVQKINPKNYNARKYQRKNGRKRSRP